MPVRPLSMLWLQFAAVVIGVGFVVILLNQNRSTGVFVIEGVPIVVPLALAILWIGQLVLDRTRFGLHIYAVGGNPEGARRAGINVTRVRISAFMICSVLAVVAGSVHRQPGRRRRSPRPVATSCCPVSAPPSSVVSASSVAAAA